MTDAAAAPAGPVMGERITWSPAPARHRRPSRRKAGRAPALPAVTTRPP